MTEVALDYDATPTLVRLVAWEKRMRALPARGLGASNRAQMPATPMLVRLVAWEKRTRASPASGLGASSRAQMPQIHVGVRVESG